MTRSTTNDSKTEYFQNFLSKKTFIKKKKHFSPEQRFQECTKNQLWSFYGVNWPDKGFFESEFFYKVWFSKNRFSAKTDAL